MKILLLPIDDRPVTWALPQMIGQVAGVRVVVPARQLLGSLTRPSDTALLMQWVDTNLKSQPFDCLLLSLDSVIYGGLVNSRRSKDSTKTLLDRLLHLKRWKSLSGNNCSILAQSSIMRISDNYDATEEKPYWSDYGKEIFAWSQQLHRLAAGKSAADLASIERKIPQDVRNDYLETRRRNFAINRRLLDLAADKVVDYLVFSLDDSGDTGLNVMEAQRLMAGVTECDLGKQVVSYPGADEVLCSLLARQLVLSSGAQPKARLEFSPPEVSLCQSRYEGQSIGETARAQLGAIGIQFEKSAHDQADFIVVIHGSTSVQGDHIYLPGQPDLRYIDTTQSVAHTMKLLEAADKPCILCDVAYANGADPLLVEQLLARKELLSKLWAYGGWNTSGNTIGSTLAIAVARWFAGRYARSMTLVEDTLKQCLFVRLADDWAYQSVVRSKVSLPVDLPALAHLMQPYLERIQLALDYGPQKLRIGLPWQRAFEIEVAVER